MSTELTQNKRVIVMRSGLAHFVREDTAKKIEQLLSNATSNQFVNIQELVIIISTSQIEGLYTIAQYDDYVKIKQGMFRCAWNTWHTKKGECDCKAEFNKQERLRRESEAREKEERPLTPAEKIALAEVTQKVREALEAKGIWTKQTVRGLKRSKLIEYQEKFGVPYQVPAGISVIEDVPSQSG